MISFSWLTFHGKKYIKKRMPQLELRNSILAKDLAQVKCQKQRHRIQRPEWGSQSNVSRNHLIFFCSLALEKKNCWGRIWGYRRKEAGLYVMLHQGKLNFESATFFGMKLGVFDKLLNYYCCICSLFVWTFTLPFPGPKPCSGQLKTIEDSKYKIL